MLLVGLTAATAAPEQIVAGLAKLAVNVGCIVIAIVNGVPLQPFAIGVTV